MIFYDDLSKNCIFEMGSKNSKDKIMVTRERSGFATWVLGYNKAEDCPWYPKDLLDFVGTNDRDRAIIRAVEHAEQICQMLPKKSVQ